MKSIFRYSIIAILQVIVILITTESSFGAKGDIQTGTIVEYKVVNDLGRRATISKMDKALDSFADQQKGKAVLEIDLKKFGDEGWELVVYERETGFAVFKRIVTKK